MADISKIKLPSGTEYNIKDYRIPGVDSTPTSGSNNIVTSGGIKSAIDTAVGSVYRVKGTKATYADLPSSGNVAGDVWNVTAAYGNYPPGTNWVWTGSAWDALGGAIDLSGKQDVLTFDSAPTANSTNPVTSGGVYTAIENSQLWEAGQKADSIQQKNTNAVALGLGSVAEGYYTQTGVDALNNKISNTFCSDNNKSGKYAHAEGNGTWAKSNFSHAEGTLSKALSHEAHAEGYNTIANDQQSHSEGFQTTANGTASHAEGTNSVAGTRAGHAEGYSFCYGKGAHSEGWSKTTDYNNNVSTLRTLDDSDARALHTNGVELNIAIGQGAHVEGINNFVDGDGAHAEGKENSATAKYAHVEGHNAHASGLYSHAEGKAHAYGKTSHAEGAAQANGELSHAEGWSNAYGEKSHSEGANSDARGKASHAEGSSTAYGYGSHAEGSSVTSTVNSKWAHAEGDESSATNWASHSEGKLSVSSGEASHAEGVRTLAQNKGEHAGGFYNKSTKTSNTFGNPGNTTFSHGIGEGYIDSNTTDRKNAIEIMENGDTYIIGIGNYNGANYSSATTLQDVINDNELITSAALNDLNDRMIDVEEQEWVTTEQYSVIDSVVRDTYTKSEIDTMLSNIGGGGSGSGSGGSGEQAVTSVTVSGSGNAVTNATFSNKALTLTKGNIATPGTLTTTSTTALSTASNEALSGNINLHKIAKTGTYSDLIGKPTIPSAPGTLNTTATTAQSTNASEALSGSVTLHKVSKTGSYNDLLNKPTIPDTSNLLSKDGGTMNDGANLTFEDFEGFSSSLNQTSLEFENDYSNYLVRIDSSFPGIKVSGNASTNNSYTIYKDHCIVQRNNNTPTTINIPSSAGTLALTSDIPVIVLDWDNDGVLNFPGVDPAEIPNNCILVLTGNGFDSYLNNKNIVTIQDDGEGGYNHYYGIVNYYSHDINDNTNYISLGLAIPYYGKLYDVMLYFDDSNSDFEYTGEESTEYLSQWDKETSISSSSSSYDNQIPTIGAVKSYVSSAVPSAVTESTVSGWGFTKNTGTLTGVSFNGASATVTNGVAAITATIPSAPGTLNTSYSSAQTTSSNESLSGTINLHKISKTGSYNDLLNKPTIPDTSNLVSKSGGTMSASAALAFIDSTGDYGTEIGPAYVSVSNDDDGYNLELDAEQGRIWVGDGTNGTTIGAGWIGVDSSHQCTIPSTSGTLALTSQIPSAPGTLVTNNTTAQTASASEALSGTINLHKVAKTGTYSDLIGTPTIPSAPGTLITNATTAQTASSGEAMSGSITLHKVAKTGTYSDLIGTPTIPTVNNSTISIQKGGTAVDSFTTNASSAKTINIPNELPSYSSSDSGKILSVNSSGQLVWITPAQIYSGSGTPSNNTGNNGDVYLQTSVS